MSTEYSFVENVSQAAQMSAGSIVSHSLHGDSDVKVVLFHFDTGEELSEHTASMPAIIHILSGEAELKLGDDKKEVSAGAWAWMPANLPHGIVAKTPVTMLLTMLKSAKK